MPRPPRVERQHGLADDLLRELAPLLAEDGIDVSRLDDVDVPTLQAALDRAVERRNMALFTPVGRARELAAATMRVAAEGIISGDTVLAAAVLDQVTPESPDDSSATVAGCIGLALGLLDEWLCGGESVAPAGLAMSVRLPPGHWTGERAAADVLALARKGRAFRALRTLIVNQGSHQLLPGCALAVAAAIQAWADVTQAPIREVAEAAVQ